MKPIQILSLLVVFSTIIPSSYGQTLMEIEGETKINVLERDNNADTLLVRLSNGNLGFRDAHTLNQFQIISISNDTVYLTDGGFIKLPDADTLNELQHLTISHDTISLSKNGNSIAITQLGCESGFWVVAKGRICMEDTLQPPAFFYDAMDKCRSIAPGCRVCTYNDFMQACAISLNPTGNQSSGWYGDLGTAAGGNGDDEFYNWNTTSCNSNNNGPPLIHNMVMLPFRCCY